MPYSEIDYNKNNDAYDDLNNNELISGTVNYHELARKLTNIPTKPGVYIYKNANGKIIYIGKAKILRNRVRSYFRSSGPRDAKTTALVKKIADLDYIITGNEAEALILEDTLIKKYKPKYNIMLKDDKTYPYIRVTNEEYPKVFVTRKVIKDGSKYFGPYTEVKGLRRLMKALRSLFFIRSCDLALNETAIANSRFKLCLDYHIKKCLGPCENLISKEEYNENIRQAISILQGRSKDIEKSLKDKMAAYAEDLKFEEASVVKNKLAVLMEYLAHQKQLAIDYYDRDVFALSRYEDLACSIIFKIREGKLIGKRHYIISKALIQSDEEIIRTTIEKWYLESDFIPDEIYLPAMPENIDFIESWLREQKHRKVDISVPKLGDKKKLLNLAQANAEFLLRDYMISISKREQTMPRAVISLQRDLRLEKPPLRIECYDNSHIQGSELVSSMVVFINGKPQKSEYRKFKSKTVEHNDDFAQMRETLYRRLKRGLEENTAMPDLMVIDGGKGQLSSVVEVLEHFQLMDKIKVIGLAKRLDEVFLPYQSDSIMLPRTSSSLKLIQQLRDEAHRFAITFHKQLRAKDFLQN